MKAGVVLLSFGFFLWSGVLHAVLAFTEKDFIIRLFFFFWQSKLIYSKMKQKKRLQYKLNEMINAFYIKIFVVSRSSLYNKKKLRL